MTMHSISTAFPRLGTLSEATINPMFYAGLRRYHEEQQQLSEDDESADYHEQLLVDESADYKRGSSGTAPPEQQGGSGRGSHGAAFFAGAGSSSSSSYSSSGTAPPEQQGGSGRGSHNAAFSVAFPARPAVQPHSAWCEKKNGLLSLHTLHLRSSWVASKPHLEGIVDGLLTLPRLQHLRLGRMRSGMKRGSVDVTPLSALTGLCLLQLACDEKLVSCLCTAVSTQ